MNNQIQNFARQWLRQNLVKLPERNQLVFKSLYSSGLNLSINEMVDRMPVGKLDLAMQQVEQTLIKVAEQTSFSKTISPNDAQKLATDMLDLDKKSQGDYPYHMQDSDSRNLSHEDLCIGDERNEYVRNKTIDECINIVNKFAMYGTNEQIVFTAELILEELRNLKIGTANK